MITINDKKDAVKLGEVVYKPAGFNRVKYKPVTLVNLIYFLGPKKEQIKLKEHLLHVIIMFSTVSGKNKLHEHKKYFFKGQETT